MRPIAGFKGETSEDGDPDSAPRKVELAVTDDDRMVPLSITVPVFFFPLLLQLQRICAAPDPCHRNAVTKPMMAPVVPVAVWADGDRSKPRGIA